jgi:hypothetical protein
MVVYIVLGAVALAIGVPVFLTIVRLVNKTCLDRDPLQDTRAGARSDRQE